MKRILFVIVILACVEEETPQSNVEVNYNVKLVATDTPATPVNVIKE
jgi:hypothetical protein